MNYEAICASVRAQQKKYLTQQKSYRKSIIADEDILKYRDYLLETMKNYPDVMSIGMTGEYIGYTHKSIATWVSKGMLKAIHYGNTLIFPKEYLIDYIVAEHGLVDARASEKYKELVQGFHKWKLKHRTK